MTDTASRSWTRRRLLGVGGATALGSLAGCIGGRSESEESGASPETTGGTTESTTGATGTATAPLGGHSAAAGLAAQPRFGPPPSEAEGTVVAFEDPSCTRCAAFERNTVPKIRERLGDRVSFVLRSYPVVYPWGEPATQAIESAFAHEMANSDSDRDPPADASTAARPGFRQGSEATWALVGHYFETQEQFDTNNVFERTRTFLADETDLDAEAVVADAEENVHDDAVQADLDAGKKAGVGQTTPTVFLFRGDEFRTSAKGSISFQVVKAALGV
ncbi:DsbA family protein [Halorussus salinus]|uniref:DsbA family protein n=1 Tax=Halorussus salinus TaxID=1364935 RepID=UPI0010924894|nr:thioredoxin domain-containing protein [Halorussus salinus]